MSTRRIIPHAYEQEKESSRLVLVRPRLLYAKTALIIAVTLLQSFAFKEGKVIAFQSTGYWEPNDLFVINTPSLQKFALVTGQCYGPCFSPDGGQVAFVRDVTGTPYIYTVASDGSSAPVSTSIPVSLTPPSDWAFQPAAHPTLNWLSLADGDYFYWVQRVQEGRGVFRAKMGTTNVELLYDDDFYWGSVDQSGTKAVATMSFTVYQIDLVELSHTFVESGCNPAISPSGNLLMHNLAHFSELCGWVSFGREHGGMHILNTVDNSCVMPFEYACTGDFNKWSHHDEDVIMWRATDEGWCGGDTPEHGMLMDLANSEQLNIGAYLAWDFYPAQAIIDTLTEEPVFSPGAGNLAAGQTTITMTSATAGATIRYTTDGSEPTALNGTQIASGGSITVTLAAGDTVNLRARAFSASYDPSVVSEATYTVPPETESYTVVSPSAGETYYVGDTMLIEWTIHPDFIPSAHDLKVSFNGGEEYAPITSTTTLLPSVTSYAWVIPAGTPSTNDAVVEIHDYFVPSFSAVSGAFTIKPALEITVQENGIASSPLVFRIVQGNILAIGGGNHASFDIAFHDLHGNKLSSKLYGGSEKRISLRECLAASGGHSESACGLYLMSVTAANATVFRRAIHLLD